MTATPWPWSAVLWLQRKCGLYMPVDLQLYVLFVGWSCPLSVEFDPLQMYWFWMRVWKGKGCASADSDSESLAVSTELRCQLHGGYIDLGGELFPELNHTFVVDVRDGTRGTVYTSPVDSDDLDKGAERLPVDSGDSGSDDSDSGGESDKAWENLKLKPEKCSGVLTKDPRTLCALFLATRRLKEVQVQVLKAYSRIERAACT